MSASPARALPALALAVALVAACSGGSSPGDDVSFEANVPRVTLSTTTLELGEDATAEFRAEVHDLDGEDDVAGGELHDEGGAVLAYFSRSGEHWEASVDWDGIHSARPIELTAPEARTFTAVFADVVGHEGADAVGVTLTCGEVRVACGGLCTDLDEPAFCGACDVACGANDPSCSPLGCVSVVEECAAIAGFTTCGQYCADHGMTCTPACGGIGDAYAAYVYVETECSVSGNVLSPWVLDGCDDDLTDVPPFDAESVRCCCAE